MTRKRYTKHHWNFAPRVLRFSREKYVTVYETRKRKIFGHRYAT